MKHQAHIVHHVPGRIRLQLPHAKGNRALLEQVGESIAPRPGVRRVELNPTTGSVVIHYDDALLDNFKNSLAEHVAQEDLFTIDTDSPREESSIARSIDKGFKEISDSIKEATDDTVDLKELFPFAVAATALFFVDKTLGAPLWVSLLLFSFSSYLDLHEPDPEPTTDVINSIKSLHEEIAALRADIRALSHQS